uniref:VIT domain-containing protein n=1 Tax=Anas platyrhynchos TaxID=8839 RepID=A0A8B9TFZ4_ANAPL
MLDLQQLPLCSAVVDVAIQDYVADVASELIYQNKSRTSSEVIFVFPLAPHMTIYSFQALNEDAKVQALLQDEVPAFRKEWGQTPEGHGMSSPWSVFACFLGSLSPGKEMVVTLRYVQELPRKLGGAAQFLLPATLHPHWNYYSEDCVIVSTMFLPAAWNCHNNKPYYSLLLTASLQSPRGVVNAEANCALTPLIYTAQDHSAAQVWPPEGSLLGDPLVLVTLSPSIPDAMPGQCQSGEFIFLLDTTFLERAQVPPQNRDQTRFGEQAEREQSQGRMFETQTWGGGGGGRQGETGQSVEYTQDNLTKAMQRIPSTSSCLGDADLLGTLRTIYNTPQPHGHARQVWPSGTPHIPVLSKEFRQRGRMLNSNGAPKVWCLALSTQVLNCLKRALKPAAEGVSLSWTLPLGLEAEVLGGTPRSIFQGEHIHLYAKIRGEAQGENLGVQDQSLSTFLQHGEKPGSWASPHSVPRLAGHRLAARCLLGCCWQTLLSGSGDEPRQRAVEISLTSGIICPFTSYVGVRTSQWVTWYQGKERCLGERSGGVSPWDVLIPQEPEPQPQGTPIIVLLQVTEPSIWATVLAVTWLQKKNRYYQGLCELLEAKAVTWLCSRAGESCFPDLHRTASSLLSPVRPTRGLIVFSFVFIPSKVFTVMGRESSGLLLCSSAMLGKP